MVFFEYSDDKISRTTSMNMNIYVIVIYRI